MTLLSLCTRKLDNFSRLIIFVDNMIFKDQVCTALYSVILNPLT
ncbi:hypothetical protein GALL_490890 [mine drainage metagenome]|uniref:Uncharacterized protein n=1 Tax=mine drainage metagenome TaxID=410659 RepID=A0A1J5PNH9_9ZZZZ